MNPASRDVSADFFRSQRQQQQQQPPATEVTVGLPQRKKAAVLISLHFVDVGAGPLLTFPLLTQGKLRHFVIFRGMVSEE